MQKASKQLIALCLGAWGVIYGQTESRTSLIEAARTEKEANLTPETAPKLERQMVSIENSLPYRLITGESGGLSVGFGNVMPGAGFAAGPQYTRTGLWKGRLNFSVRGARFHQRVLSRPYWTSHCRTSLATAYLWISARPTGTSRRCRTTARGRIRERPGAATTGWKTRMWNCVPAVRCSRACAPASSAPTWPSTSALGTRHDTFRASSSSVRMPRPASTGRRISGAAEASSNMTGATRPAYPTSGGKYSAQYVRYLDRNLGAYSFLRLDLDASQYFPLFNRTRVFAAARIVLADHSR